MPQAFVSDVGSNYLTRLLLRDPTVPTGDWYLRIFVNNFAPNVESVPGDFVEATWPGYSPVLLDPVNWLPPFVGTYGSTSFWGNQPQQFKPTSGSYSLYGWYVTLETSLFLWGQQFSASVGVNPTSPFVIQPVWAGISVYRPLPP